MSVILQFTIGLDNFELGAALGGEETGRVELERIVPAGGEVIPFFWVFGGEPTILEANVAESSYIENLTVIDEVGNNVLYRVAWTGEREDLLHGIADEGGTILEAQSNGEGWAFRLRFPDHQHIADFYDYCGDSGLDIRVEKVYTLTEETFRGRAFDLTADQRRALLLAVDRGYFATPRETSMATLATELDISQQAFSDRLRRGLEKVLESTLGE